MQCADETGLSPLTNDLGFIVKPMHQLNMNIMLGKGIKRKKSIWLKEMSKRPS